MLNRAVTSYAKLLYGERNHNFTTDARVRKYLLPQFAELPSKFRPALLPPLLKIASAGGLNALFKFADLNISALQKLVQLNIKPALKPQGDIRIEKRVKARRVIGLKKWLPDNKGSMSSYQRFDTAVKLEEPDRVPLALLMDYFYARIARMTPRQFINSGYDNIFRAVRYTHDLFENWFDMAHVPMGAIYSYFEPVPAAHPGFYSPLIADDKLGGILQFVETPVLDVKDFLIIQEQGFSSLWRPIDVNKVIQTMFDFLTLAPHVNYWERKRKVPLYSASGIVTPLEVLSYLMGLSRWARGMLKHRDAMKQMCDWMFPGLQANDLFLKLLGGVPRAYICLERVSPRFIRTEIFKDLVWPYIQRIVAQNNALGLTNLFHMDTDWGKFLPFFATLPPGKYIFHLENTDIRQAKDIIGHRG